MSGGYRRERRRDPVGRVGAIFLGTVGGGGDGDARGRGRRTCAARLSVDIASAASPNSARAIPYASAASAFSGAREHARFRSRMPSSKRSKARWSFPDSMRLSMALPPPTPRDPPTSRLAFLSLPFVLFFLLLPGGGMTRGEDVLRSREWRPAAVGGGHDEFSVPARLSEPIINCSAAAVNF